MDRAELATAIGTAAFLEGSFRLRSGAMSSEYFDKYQFESIPSVLGAIAELASDAVPDGTDMLAGLEIGGIPIATALSLRCDIPVVFVRKKAKSYGTRKLAEGPDFAGRRLLVIEDVITSGGQVVQSTQALREHGAIVSDVLCVVDREEGGVETLSRHGLSLHALFTGSELKVSAGR